MSYYDNFINRDNYEKFVKDCLKGKDITKWLEILDPSKYDNEAIKKVVNHYAPEKEKLNLIKKLLDDPRVAKSINYCDLLYILCSYDDILSVEYILDNIKPDFTEDNKKNGENNCLQTCFQQSLHSGAYRCTRLFLHDSRVNVTIYGTSLLYWSIKYYNVFHMFLQDPRVDPNANDNYIIEAIYQNKYDVLCLILSDSRINIPDYIYKMADQNIDPSIRKVLIEHSFSLDSINYNKNIIE